MKSAADSEYAVRKVRKKLRQVENLERQSLERELTQEELLKIRKKSEYREWLQELLSSCTGMLSSSILVGLEEGDSSLDSSNELCSTRVTNMPTACFDDTLELGMSTINQRAAVLQSRKTDFQAANDVCFDKEPASSTNSEPASSTSREPASLTSREPASLTKNEPASSTSREPASSSTSEPSTKKVKLGVPRRSLAMEKSLRGSRFYVRELNGHNGVLTAMTLRDDTLVTASRDTTVRVWSVSRGVELRSLGGHTDTVTSVVLLTQSQSQSLERCLRSVDDNEGEAFMSGGVVDSVLALSAALDCSVRIWSIHTGECLKVMYTFNPLTSLAFADQTTCVLCGSDAGKLEVWSPVHSMFLHSLLAHRDAVTALQVDGRHVCSCSKDGDVCVFELDGYNTLQRIFNLSDARTRLGTPVFQRPIRCMTLKDDYIFYGDDGMNVKVVNWKTGVVDKLCNHTTEFGCTEAIAMATNLLVAAGYDLDNGLGYVNIRLFPELTYLCSLCDESTDRIVCLACEVRPPRDEVTVVTGGGQLKVWTRITKPAPGSAYCMTDSSDCPMDVAAQFVPQFDKPARQSDAEIDSDDADSADEGVASLPWNRREEEPSREGKHWCTLC